MRHTTYRWILSACLWLFAVLPGLAQATQYAIYNSLNGFVLDGATIVNASATSSGAITVEAVDLSQGSLKVRAVQSASGATIEGDVRFGDTITVLGLSAPTTITMQLQIKGALSGRAIAVSSLFIGGPGLDRVASPSPSIDFAGNAYGGGLESTLLVDDLLQVSMMLTPAASTFSFAAGLAVTAHGPVTVGGLSGSAEFGNSARIELLLPVGTSFSSASGVFLQAVPLSPSVWLLAPALATLAHPKFRRNHGRGRHRIPEMVS